MVRHRGPVPARAVGFVRLAISWDGEHFEVERERGTIAARTGRVATLRRAAVGRSARWALPRRPARSRRNGQAREPEEVERPDGETGLRVLGLLDRNELGRAYDRQLLAMRSTEEPEAG